MAKTVYFMNGGVNSYWSTDGNWSTTGSSGPANSTHAVATDTAIFDAGSPNCIVDTASACATLTMTNYAAARTFTFNGTLTITASSTLPTAAVTFAGTSDLICTTSLTITANSKTLPGGLQLKGTSQTYVITGTTLGVTGLLTLSGTTGIVVNTASSGALSVAGGITVSTATTGTCGITMTGGTFRSTAAAISNSITIAGNVTLYSGTNLIAASGTPTWTYSSGTITYGTSVLSVASSMTFTNTGGQFDIYDLIITAAATITINTNILYMHGTLTLSTGICTFAGNNSWTCVNLAQTTTTAAVAHVLANSLTYTVTTDMTILSARSSYGVTFNNTSGTTRAILTLALGATQKLCFVSAGYIDSSLGQTICGMGGTVTNALNWASGVTSGNLIPLALGGALAVAGVTKDSTGAVDVSSVCYLCRDNGNNTMNFIAYQTSNGTTGAYSFTTPAGSTYFVVSFKTGPPNVMDVTDRTLSAA